MTDELFAKCQIEGTGHHEAYLELERLLREANDEGEYCIDNLRLACEDNPSELEDYEEQVRDGCCGSCDEEYLSEIDNKIYKIGYNYGH